MSRREFDRKFMVWEYWVSHSQLVLRSLGDMRSPAGSSRSRNIDLNFVAVEYMEVPAILPSLVLDVPTVEEHQRAEALLRRNVQRDEVFVLASLDRRYLVIAGNMTISENDLPMNRTTVDRL